MNQIDVTDIYRTFYPKAKEYTFSETHGTFFKADYLIIHKTGLSRYKKIEIISCTLSDHHVLRLVLNNNNNNNNSNNKKQKAHIHMGAEQDSTQ